MHSAQLEVWCLIRSAVPGTLVNLGNLDIAQNRLDEGRQHFEEAIEIYAQPAEQNPGTYLSESTRKNVETSFIIALCSSIPCADF